jgi:hypothetical protein
MGIKNERPRDNANIVRTAAELARAAQLDRDLAEQLIERARREGVNLVGEGGLLSGLVKLVLEGALEAEMTEHLGYEKGDQAGAGSSNSRNGRSRKTVLADVGPVELDIPRDRAGSFTPAVVPKHSRRVQGTTGRGPRAAGSAGAASGSISTTRSSNVHLRILQSARMSSTGILGGRSAFTSR